MCAAPVPNWRQLAEAASKETDHNKLLKIVGQLCDSLDKVHTNEQSTGQDPSEEEAPSNGNGAERVSSDQSN